METRMLTVISQEGIEREIEIMGDDQIAALGGVADVFTWLRWFREHRDLFAAMQGFLNEFTNAQGWAARMAAIGRAMDALQAVFVTSPVEIPTAILAAGDADTLTTYFPAEFIAAEWEAAEASISALRIDWGGVLKRLPELITFVQTVADMIRRFQGAGTQALSAVHGLRYVPLNAAAA